MDGVEFVLMLALAGLWFWGWSGDCKVSKLCEENMKLKEHLAESATALAAEKLEKSKLSVSLADAESKLAAVNKKIIESDQQL